MPTLDDIRADGEAALDEVLAKLDERHKRKLRAALKRYGSVANIPENVWREIQNETEEELVAAIMLLIIAADDFTAADIERQGVRSRRQVDIVGYSVSAARQATTTARETTETIRSRLERKSTDAQVSPKGGVGTLTNDGIEEAIDDVYTQQRRGTIAVDATTQALTTGQRGAADRGDGARTEAGQKVELELYWVTERDNLVCPRCAPLHDKPESVWGRVFPEGPGPAAHPNCRCSLRPVVVVIANEAAA